MHHFRHILIISALLAICTATQAQAFSPVYMAELNKSLPHKFKTINVGTTMEAIRVQEMVKVYVLIDDIEQYEQVLIERSDEFGTNFSQCKLINVEKGKYRNNYLELTDRYPVSTKMATMYRIKTITSDGIIRMYPPVSVSKDDDKATGLVQK